MQKSDSRSLTGLISCGSNRAVKCDLMNSEYDGLWDLAAPPLPGSHHPVSPWTIVEEINWLFFLSHSNKAHSLSSVGRSQAQKTTGPYRAGHHRGPEGELCGELPKSWAGACSAPRSHFVLTSRAQLGALWEGPCPGPCVLKCTSTVHDLWFSADSASPRCEKTFRFVSTSSPLDSHWAV